MHIFTDQVPASPDIAPFAVGLAYNGETKELYDDWEILSFQSYTFEDKHPGVPKHLHSVNKIVAVSKNPLASRGDFFADRKGIRGSPSANRERSLLALFLLRGLRPRFRFAEPQKQRGVDTSPIGGFVSNLFGNNVTVSKNPLASRGDFFADRKGIRGSPSTNRERSLLALFLLRGLRPRFRFAEPQKQRGVVALPLRDGSRFPSSTL